MRSIENVFKKDQKISRWQRKRKWVKKLSKNGWRRRKERGNLQFHNLNLSLELWKDQGKQLQKLNNRLPIIHNKSENQTKQNLRRFQKRKNCSKPLIR
jgi:hypothetical protein